MSNISNISMDIHRKSVDMAMDMDGKFHIYGKPDYRVVQKKRTPSFIFGITSVAEWLECWTQVNFTRARGPGFDSWTDPSSVAELYPGNIEILA